jgi:hypothetical protein
MLRRMGWISTHSLADVGAGRTQWGIFRAPKTKRGLGISCLGSMSQKTCSAGPAQGGGIRAHGGMVLSEESRKEQMVLFQAFGGYRVTEENLKHLEKIWPKG